MTTSTTTAPSGTRGDEGRKTRRAGVITIKSCSWFPPTESAVWVEVGSGGFAARGRIFGEEEVKLATAPTRHYSVALARAEAWAAAYKVPVVYVIAASPSDEAGKPRFTTPSEGAPAIVCEPEARLYGRPR